MLPIDNIEDLEKYYKQNPMSLEEFTDFINYTENTEYKLYKSIPGDNYIAMKKAQYLIDKWKLQTYQIY